MQDGVVPGDLLGFAETRTDRGAQAVIPVGRDHRGYTRWSGHLSRSENQDDVGATTVAQRAARGL